MSLIKSASLMIMLFMNDDIKNFLLQRQNNIF